MPVDIMLTVVATTMIQSLFGAGVLLFGTPLLLLFGHGFVEVLVVLLPISIGINLLQIIKHHVHIDFAFYRNVLILTLPPIALFLFLVTHARINISLLIGVFLLFIACKEYSASIAKMLDRMMAFEKTYFLLMGIVHGVSNLGGSLLTALVHHKHYEKDAARVTVAASYATFAAVQLLTLWLFSAQQIDLSINHTAVYLLVGMLVFMLSDEMLYNALDRAKYQRFFAAFLAVSGLTLIVKSLN
ncbi:TSUP family transporter [Methylomicrobium agile]|uniref:TSUP family transporter n=1 Tax=Methylomicrobium agile TaxID=39774 RepID=UPI0004DFCC2F|nr:TSUP family transporter [Methylomicrobium agile]